ncbi:MAG: lipid-A-disaccharide synthase N-terminal domain-containing protein [Planctomycetota bacterium]|nr:lipid-A-disaccharide synthase N-terminal domain-containing protein [Planctomycetota bacterium]
MTLEELTSFWRHPRLWLLLGCLGQLLFTARFLLQWLATERLGATVIPHIFWRLSLCGGMAMLAYALSRRDPVVAVGQTMGLVFYARNLIIATKPVKSSGHQVRSRSRQIRDPERDVPHPSEAQQHCTNECKFMA